MAFPHDWCSPWREEGGELVWSPSDEQHEGRRGRRRGTRLSSALRPALPGQPCVQRCLECGRDPAVDRPLLAAWAAGRLTFWTRAAGNDAIPAASCTKGEGEEKHS